LSVLFDEVLFYTTRFKTVITCGSEDDQTRELFASGIWFATPKGGKNLFYATNRHLVDYDFDKKGWHHMGANSIASVDIELRKFNGNTPSHETKFFNLVSPPNKVYYPKDNSDLAIISISTNQTVFQNATKQGYRPMCISMDSFLADNTYFIKSLKLVDSVSFIGFPKGVFDTDRNLPIARNANIASAPSLPFKNDAVEGEIVLVSGLSFGGSSGSPVISIPVGNKGIGVGRVLESKLVGIMAGHLVDKDDKHKGLSYFIKSPKIIDTLKENNLI